MTDASALGILPPATVRIDMDGWVQDWPWETVRLDGERIGIVNITAVTVRHDGVLHSEIEERVTLYYPYEHAHQRPDGSWLFVGGITHRDFTVTAGPPQAPSVN